MIQRADAAVVAPRDTAGIGRSAARAFTVLSSAAVTPTGVRPSLDSVAARLYGSRARLETAVAVNERYGLVWLEPDASADTAGVLPFRIFGYDERAGRLRALIPVVDGRAGLRYAPAGGYRGEVLVGFTDSLAPTADAVLDPPLSFVLGGNLESVTPESIRVERLLRRTRVVLADRRRPSNPVLRLHPSTSATSIDIPLAVQLDSLSITVPRRMRGLGTEEAVVTVRVPPGVLDASDSLEVTLQIRRGAIVGPPSAYARENRAATFRFRSVGLGLDTVLVSSGPMVADPAYVRYDVPWALLALAVAGATFGAVLRWWSSRRKDPKARFPVPRLALSVLVVAALSVGVNELGQGFTLQYSEVAVFVLAAIFAAGLKTLDWKKEDDA